jgi:Protein of unknown function (DUF2442)
VIKVLTVKPHNDFVLELTFSNGDTAHFDGADCFASRDGSLLEPLRQSDFFKRCFIDAGAVCWPNGLELSAERIYELSRVLA